MKNILVISLITLLGTIGCEESNRRTPSGENIECKRLRLLWERVGEENPQIIIPETENESGDEITWQELGEMVFSAVGCCFCEPHPLAKEWTECNQLKCIWKYLEKEKVQRIAFYKNVMDEDTSKPENWHNLWSEIIEPEKISETIRLFCKTIKMENNKFVNEEVVLGHYDQMQIITDKHKFIIPISIGKKAIGGIGWTSYELREQLKKWEDSLGK